MMPQEIPPYHDGEREMKRRLREDMNRIEAEADFVELAFDRLQDTDDPVISSEDLRKRLFPRD
jgi:hypothetical protein